MHSRSSGMHCLHAQHELAAGLLQYCLLYHKHPPARPQISNTANLDQVHN
jgi:hypothetical protein